MERSGFSGTDAVRRRLADGQKLSHAYIITGPDGAGRQALAEQLAAAWVCTSKGDKPCGACAGCRKALAGIHPDIAWLRPLEGKRVITVDQVRALRAGAYIRPNEAARRVYLIDPAQAMNSSAQNAMLKLLEEGPAYAAFALITGNAQALLPTVRSRCELLTLAADEPAPGECAPNPAAQEAARQLAGYILRADRQGLLECAAALESKKWDKDAALALLDETARALHPALPQRPEALLPWLEQIKRLRQAAQYNVGVGHLLGWLAAGPN